MGLFDGLAKKIANKQFKNLLYNPRYDKFLSNLTNADKEKFLVFAEKFIKNALNFGSFISFSLITFYLYDKLGVEKLGLFYLLLIFMQLTIMNQKLGELSKSK